MSAVIKPQTSKVVDSKPASRSTRPSTSKTVPQSPVQQAVKGKALAPVTPLEQEGTLPWLDTLFEKVKEAGSTFAATGAVNVEPLPPDSDYISASRLIGVTLLLMDVEFKYVDYGRGPVLTAQFTVYIDSRRELGKRYVSLSSKRALAQAKSLQANDSFPLLATIEKDKPAFEGATPGNMLADPREEEATYYHAPYGEDLEKVDF